MLGEIQMCYVASTDLIDPSLFTEAYAKKSAQAVAVMFDYISKNFKAKKMQLIDSETYVTIKQPLGRHICVGNIVHFKSKNADAIYPNLNTLKTLIENEIIESNHIYSILITPEKQVLIQFVANFFSIKYKAKLPTGFICLFFI